jgi:hypothetical protein
MSHAPQLEATKKQLQDAREEVEREKKAKQDALSVHAASNGVFAVPLDGPV